MNARQRAEGFQRKEESIRTFCGGDEGKAEYCCGGSTEEMMEWKRFKTERNGPMLEEFGLMN